MKISHLPLHDAKVELRAYTANVASGIRERRGCLFSVGFENDTFMFHLVSHWILRKGLSVIHV